MAISKERKQEMVAQYVQWFQSSQAMFVTEYTGLKMKDMDALRAKVRESGGEFHVIKNTLAQVAMAQAGLQVPPSLLEGSTAFVFAFQDVAAAAKALAEFTRTSEFVKVKGGFLERKAIGAEEVKALAELPPLPQMRAQLLGTILAPASQLARTLAEPARQVAAVLRAFSEKEGAAAPA